MRRPPMEAPTANRHRLAISASVGGRRRLLFIGGCFSYCGNFRQTRTRWRVGVGGRLMSRVSQRIAVTVIHDTLRVKRYIPRKPQGGVVMPAEHTSVPIRDLVRYYLRLGVLGFGGPVALVGQMERELVDEKKWLTKEEMREGIAVCQSLPGPLAIQDRKSTR